MEVSTMTYPIKHVFVVMFENRSFDHMLGFTILNGTDPGGNATTLEILTGEEENSDDSGIYSVGKHAPVAMPYDPGHEFENIQQQIFGPTATSGPVTMGGFVASAAKTSPTSRSLVMQCFTPNQLPVINQLAAEFAVCDHWFASLPGPTGPNRFFAHAATSGGLDYSPDAPSMALGGGLFSFQNGTIYDALHDKGLKWRVYHADNFPQCTLIQGMPEKLLLGPEFKTYSAFRDDLNSGSYDYSYTFIEPNYGDHSYRGGNSQHPLNDITAGDQFLKDVYESIRNSPVWNESMLFVMYDEHGGFFDHVHPPDTNVVPPGDQVKYNKNGFTFNRLGVRVPALVISPYVQRNTIDHSIYDHTSMLRTVEKLFGLDPLTNRDQAADDLLKVLTLGAPRSDTPITLLQANTAAAPNPNERLANLAATDTIDGMMHTQLISAMHQDMLMNPDNKEAIQANVATIDTRTAATNYLGSVAVQANEILLHK